MLTNKNTTTWDSQTVAPYQPKPVERLKRQKKTRQFSAAESAIYRHRQGIFVAERLEESAHHLDDLDEAAEALAIADCIRESASAENIYFSIGQTDERTGRKFDAFSSLSTPAGTVLDLNYQAKQSRRRKKAILAKLIEHKVINDGGELLAFSSGSLRHFPQGHRLRSVVFTSPNLDCDEQTDLLIHQRAMRLFKDSNTFKSRIYGGYIKLELTEGKQEQIHTHWHYHALLVSKWIDKATWESKWTSCYEKACAEFGIEASFHQNIHIYIQDVVEYAKENSLTVEKAVSEIAKYTAKSESLLNFPAEQLAKILLLLDGLRTIESIGAFNNHQGASTRSRERDNVIDAPLVHTGTHLSKKDSNPARRSAFIRQGIELIKSGRRAEWLKLLREREEKRRAFRREQLVMLNPEAIFFDVTGRKFSSSDLVCPNKRKILSLVSLSDRVKTIH